MVEQNLDPETVDLASLRASLARTCGAFVAGEVVGRTLLRDAVAERLGCSLLAAEQIVDTMIGRGFLRRELAGGVAGWSTEGPGD